MSHQRGIKRSPINISDHNFFREKVHNLHETRELVQWLIPGIVIHRWDIWKELLTKRFSTLTILHEILATRTTCRKPKANWPENSELTIHYKEIISVTLNGEKGSKPLFVYLTVNNNRQSCESRSMRNKTTLQFVMVRVSALTVDLNTMGGMH